MWPDHGALGIDHCIDISPISKAPAAVHTVQPGCIMYRAAMQHADTFKHPMRTGDDVTVVDMRHLGRTKRQLIVDKGTPANQPLRIMTFSISDVLRLNPSKLHVFVERKPC